VLLVSDELMSCCAVGTDGCLDLRHRAFPIDGRVSADWSLFPGSSGTACKRQCDSFAMKLSRFDACEDWKVVRWCRMQASSHSSQGVVDGRTMRREHCGTSLESSTQLLNGPGLRWLFAVLLL